LMHRTGRGKKNPLHLAVAKRRIAGLYELSIERVREGDLDLARRYTELAKKIGMRYTVRIPQELKQMTCRSCMVPLVPGKTSRTRIRDGSRVVTCTECGFSRRIGQHRGNDDGQG
jgi:ribonuclease P protein subunit RPR2